MSTLSLFEMRPRKAVDDWTFRGANTRYFTHAYHDYPARMIPQIADRLLREYAPSARSLFDPYCGTGTTLVEGLLHGMETYGTDLNPLARLLASAKTTYIDERTLDSSLRKFMEFSMETHSEDLELPPWLDEDRVRFWFKPRAVVDLRRVYSFIEHIEDKPTELFFLTAFSETIRECSNTRPGEFKLFRRPKEELDRYTPDVFGTMMTKLGRNREAYGDMLGFMGPKSNWKPSHIFDFDTVSGIPTDALGRGLVDVVITSPPYGDSRTTVAYGQFSRLSSEWLAFPEARRVDSMLLGGHRLRSMPVFSSEKLNGALSIIAARDKQRALEISAFYQDLEKSIKNVAAVVRSGGVVCYVVANRRVRSVDLPTDENVVVFFRECGFRHVATLRREIPNKRMPSRNSPTNESGATDTTMVRENIIVMQKE
ncbi:MAG: DNA methyltransferase [bacterium]|nr:DNA methyltransferase [bacterium]